MEALTFFTSDKACLRSVKYQKSRIEARAGDRENADQASGPARKGLKRLLIIGPWRYLPTATLTTLAQLPH